MKVLLITALLALGMVPSALAVPKPERPNGKRIHWVSYTYTYRSSMVAKIDGHTITIPIVCHVPAHGKRYCVIAG